MVPNMDVDRIGVDRIGEALAGRASEDLRGRLAIRSFTDCLRAWAACSLTSRLLAGSGG